MSNKRKLIIALVLLFIGLTAFLLYYYRDKIFKSSSASAEGANQGNDNTTTPPRDAEHPEFPLAFGSRNDFVKKYQQYLLVKENCLPKYGADGWWGNETETCSVKVTSKNSITWNDYKGYGLT